ncbi:MAG: hypothetical protein HC810_06415 [Acaryochloridaceae cyanobacterium RL_2_7]|nr:hypothetical protein [Acaryochloridaceae cyanobacterium RL_2_7]
MNLCCESIQASLIRQVWEVIEQTHSGVLLHLKDEELVRQLLVQLQHRRTLNCHELEGVSHYLSDRTLLIRDLVANRPSL